MIEPYEKIYIQWYPQLEEDCTWFQDKIDENDTEYILYDIYKKALAEIKESEHDKALAEITKLKIIINDLKNINDDSVSYLQALSIEETANQELTSKIDIAVEALEDIYEIELDMAKARKIIDKALSKLKGDIA